MTVYFVDTAVIIIITEGVTYKQSWSTGKEKSLASKQERQGFK